MVGKENRDETARYVGEYFLGNQSKVSVHKRETTVSPQFSETVFVTIHLFIIIAW